MAQEVRALVRFAGTDLNGKLPVARALCKIKGIRIMFARSACTAAGIDPSAQLGTLDERALAALEAALTGSSMPVWMLNRRKDPESGTSYHLIGASLELKQKEDILLGMKRIRCYKGVRHELGLPVRGQRTRTSFRSKRAVGVIRKTARAAAKAESSK